MNDIVRVGGKLALICAVAAVALGLVNAVTAPAIEKVKERQLATALDAVRGTAQVGEERVVEDVPIVEGYYPLTEDGASAGYILKLTGMGYAGDMEILASYASDGGIRAVALTNNSETPGLGKEAEKPEYMEKYTGSGAERPVPMNKQQLTQEQADSISGASITFMGIAQALKAGSDYVKEQLGK